MKCVKLKNGPIKRITDSEASKLVGAEKAVYVGKELWKKHVRGPVDSAKCEGRSL